MLRPLDVEKVPERYRDMSVDRLPLKCQVCGTKGEPYVWGHVEGVGSQRLWPKA